MPSAQQSPNPLASSWKAPAVIIFSAAVILGLNMGLRQTFGLFLEPITFDLEISRSNFALAIAVQNLLWGLLTPFFGMLADRAGTARVLVVGGLIYATGLVLMALSTSAFDVHLGAGIVIGIAVSACGFPMVLAAVARLTTPSRRSLYLGLASAGGSAGQFVLLPFSQLLIEDMGWSQALLILACLSLLIVPLAAALSGKPSTSRHATDQSLSAALHEASRHRGFILLNGGFFVCGFHVAFIAIHLPGYIVSCNLSPLVGATALGVVGFFNIIGGVMAGVLGGRFRKKNLLALIYLSRALVIAVFMIGPKTEMAVWLFSAAFGLLWLSTVPLTSALVGQLFGPRYMATLVGIVMLSHQVGAFFGAYLGGLSYDLTGSYDSVWYISIALGLLAAAFNWPIKEASPRVVAETA